MSAERLLIRRRKVSDYGADSQQRGVGLAVALARLGAVAVAVTGTIAAGNLAGSVGGAEKVAGLAAWSFGLSSAAFATIKVGIAVILAGILVRLWTRVEAVKSSLPRLVGGQQAKPGPFGATSVDTPFGQATLSASTPGPLLIHRMARVMWAPSLAMGYMAVLAGLALSIIQSSRIGSDPELALRLSAWVPGVQFLGEGLVLGGIAFLLGSILASLRAGGGEVQEALGVPVKTSSTRWSPPSATRAGQGPSSHGWALSGRRGWGSSWPASSLRWSPSATSSVSSSRGSGRSSDHNLRRKTCR